jgi:hypothetical protein
MDGLEASRTAPLPRNASGRDAPQAVHDRDPGVTMSRNRSHHGNA